VADAPQAAVRSARLAALLAKVALGDQQAFADLYRNTSSHLYGVAVRILREGAAAEEVLQDAFVSVWHHAGSYHAAKSQPLTWLSTIVRNRCLDQLRRRELDTVTMTLEDDDGKEFDLPSGDPTPVEMLLAGAQARLVRDCVDALDAGQKQRSRWRSIRGCRTPSWPTTCASRWGPSSHGCAVAWKIENLSRPCRIFTQLRRD
jgi:RNA polymerase sigma-70 factor (ECF subfamily)